MFRFLADKGFAEGHLENGFGIFDPGNFISVSGCLRDLPFRKDW
jgi:hypothetical protein